MCGSTLCMQRYRKSVSNRADAVGLSAIRKLSRDGVVASEERDYGRVV